MAKVAFFVTVLLGITAGLVLASESTTNSGPKPFGFAYKAPGLHLRSWPQPTETPTPPPPPPPRPTPYCTCEIRNDGWECITCCY